MSPWLFWLAMQVHWCMTAKKGVSTLSEIDTITYLISEVRVCSEVVPWGWHLNLCSIDMAWWCQLGLILIFLHHYIRLHLVVWGLFLLLGGCCDARHIGGLGVLVMILWFSSWVVLFSSSLPFMPHLLSWGPFPMLTIIIFLLWDPSHSLYTPSNPYAVPYTTTGQGTLFTYLFLVMDNYSFSRFSHICCMLLLLILLSMTFHDIPFLLSRTFYLVPLCSFAYSADLLLSI